MLIPGLRDLAAANHWHIDAYVSRGCVWSQSDLTNTHDACHPRNEAMQTLFETGTKYDLIILTARRDLSVPEGSKSRLFATAPAQWAPVAARGTKIVAVADNPLVPEALIDCVVDAASDSAAS